METEQHYFRVGLYVLLCTLGIALFTAWILSDGVRDSQKYRIYFAESVSGLNLGSPVKYRGVSVGTVQDIAIDKKNPQLVRVMVEIGNNTPVKASTTASLKLQGITGTVFIELSGGEASEQDLVELTPKGKTPVIPSESSSIQALMNQLPQIMDKLSNFADQLAKISTDENIERFNEALNNLALLSGNLNNLTTDTREVLHDTRGNIVESTQQMNGTMTNLRKASRDVRNVTERVEDDPSSLIFPPDEEGIPAP
jgi:phospholipid/cholesterol/gamma-HCH transport system substrate-binding protein